MIFHGNSLLLLLLLLLRCSVSNALQPFMGGTLFWSIVDGFEVRSEDRIVNFTLISAFIRSPKCNYSIGEPVSCHLDGVAWCGSDPSCAVAARHGLLNLAPLSEDGTIQTDGRISVPNVLRVLELDASLDAAWVVGVLHIATHAPDSAAAVLAWLSPNPLDPDTAASRLPICNASTTVAASDIGPKNVCSFSLAAADGDVAAARAEVPSPIDSYWAGLPALDDTSIAAPARALLRAYVPVCPAGAGRIGCAARGGPLENRHSPIAPFPPLSPVPVSARARLPLAVLVPARGEAFLPASRGDGKALYAAPLPPFRLVAADEDGDTVVFLVGADSSGSQQRTGKCYPAAPTGQPSAPPAWPDSLCNADSPAAGRPCASDADCGPARGFGLLSRTAASKAKCMAERRCGEADAVADTGSSCSAGVGGQLKLDFAFPISKDVHSLFVARSVAYTMDLSPSRSHGTGRAGSWRNGTTVTVTAFSSYPSDCGPAGTAPAFGSDAAAATAAAVSGSGGESASEAACLIGRVCEVIVFAAVAAQNKSLPDGVQVQAFVYQASVMPLQALAGCVRFQFLPSFFKSIFPALCFSRSLLASSLPPSPPLLLSLCISSPACCASTRYFR